VDEIKKLIAQFGLKSRDEFFKLNYSMISLKCYNNLTCAHDDLIRLKRFIMQFSDELCN
jgi:hypothetical protein